MKTIYKVLIGIVIALVVFGAGFGMGKLNAPKSGVNTADVAELNAQITALTTERDAATSQVNSLTAERDAATSQVNSLTAERDAVLAGKSDVAKITADRDAAVQTATQLQSQLDAAVFAVDNAANVTLMSDPATDTTPAVVYGYVADMGLVDSSVADPETNGARVAIEIPEASAVGQGSGVILGCGSVNVSMDASGVGAVNLPKPDEMAGNILIVYQDAIDPEHDLNSQFYAWGYKPGHCRYTIIENVGSYEEFLVNHAGPAIANMLGANLFSGTNCGDSACTSLVSAYELDEKTNTVTGVDYVTLDILPK